MNHACTCRLILIAEKDTVYEKFPTPLINRLEKHFVLTSSILEDWQREVLTVFEKWIQDFARTRYIIHYNVFMSRFCYACTFLKRPFDINKPKLENEGLVCKFTCN